MTVQYNIVVCYYYVEHLCTCVIYFYSTIFWYSISLHLVHGHRVYIHLLYAIVWRSPSRHLVVGMIWAWWWWQKCVERCCWWWDNGTKHCGWNSTTTSFFDDFYLTLLWNFCKICYKNEQLHLRCCWSFQ